MPKPLTWKKLKSKGDEPNSRFGHTMVEMDKGLFVLFGGLDNKRKNGKIMPNNEVYSLKIQSNGEAVWNLINCEGDVIPLPRSNHCACKTENNLMFVFGGLYSSNQRFNDVHLLKTVTGSKKYYWSQPKDQKPIKSEPKNTQSKIGAPAPRANCTASYIPAHKKVYVIGGHGGEGYSRKAFIDIHSFDCETHEWSKIDAIGASPRERGGHSADVLPDSTKIFIYGGWNSITQFEDFFVFDCETREWIDLDTSSHDTARWCHSSALVPALPNWKLFVFGGSNQDFDEGSLRKFADLSNSCAFIDIKKDLKQSRWRKVKPITEEETCFPTPRENTSMVYEAKNNRLIVFGGWANKYMGDIYELNISSITGPLYAIYSIEPERGPYTGSTECIITGEGFIPNHRYIVEFNAGKGPITSTAEYISKTEIKCETPDFTSVGPKPAEVRVRANDDDLTLTHVDFRFYLNTQPSLTLAFGPGLLQENKTETETVFYIQARNKLNSNRTSGNDKYDVLVYREVEEQQETEEGEIVTEVIKEEIECKVEDLGIGQYKVTYKNDQEGEVKIEVFFENDQRKMEQIRGSPFVANFKADAPAENNEFTGPQMTNYISDRLSEIATFIQETGQGINTEDDKFKTDREALIVVKQNTTRIADEKDKTLLDLEVIEQALTNFKVEGHEKEDNYEETKQMINDMKTLEEECFQTEKKILNNMKDEKNKCENELSEFVKDLKRYFLSLGKMEIYTNYDAGIKKSFEDIEIIEEKIDEYKEKLSNFERYTYMFSIDEGTDEATKFLDKIISSTKAMRGLWEQIKLAQDTFEAYLKLEWKELHAEEMEDKVKQYQKQLMKMKGVDKKSNSYQGINKEIRNWLVFLPLISELKQDAMIVDDDRHWEAVREQLKIDFVIDDETKLQKFWDMNIYDIKLREEIEEITDRAKQERKIEKNLSMIDEKWNAVKFNRVPIEMKEGTIETIKLDDEEIEVLEEHQLLIQNIAASKFMGYFREKVEFWQDGLSAISDTMALMAEVQKTWSFLINLFIYSEEVKKELPKYSQDFIQIDKEVKALLENSKSNEVILEYCIQEYEGEKILQKLEEISKELGKCQKGLNDFIASKRKVFPRFYFLTMEELLDILANGNNPKLLFSEKNYMNKIVQAIENLQMKEEGERPRIVSLKSAVGVESVDFINSGIKLVGKVEIYLQDVLKCIKDTIHKNAEESRKTFKSSGDEKRTWIVKGLAQLNLLTNAIMWVQETEKTFEKLSDDSEAMSNFLGKVKGSLMELITYVQGKLEKPVRKKMMCLITIETHNRDVIEKLVREKVIKADAFQWQSQLKFYYNKSKDDVNVRIADASLWYSYEYLGNGARLVVTDLTDRIYVTATQALHLKMGCAPAGPAGTGKTETTKDLASAVGKPCYVFNCSPEMDYITMGNTFKGLASSGAWGCFDEFNRLKPEVLSVCTVQFKSVLDAIKAGVSKFKMDQDDELDLDPTCGAFITMNPGYIGRAELPEGLKALFRPITVVVPDLEMICENILMAEGFHQAKVLARKFTTLYSLSSDLLSDQPHYDWGLRAIKSVLVVAGEFKRNDTILNDEAKLLFRALRDSNDPKIAQVDKGIFAGLLDALFPGCQDVARQRDMDFEAIIEKVVIEEGYTAHPEFIKKVVQLKELMAIRHCVFIMGPAASGRTSTYKMLAKAQTAAGEKTTCQDIDPKCVSTRDLYGYTNMLTKEWKNGLLSHYMQHFSEVTTDGKPKWIILDGDLDANWIESMNSVMDDNKLLTLANNGRIILRDYMKMLFEIRDLRFATLATVTRAGIIYISDDSLYQLDCYYDSWVKKVVKEHEALDPKNVKDPEDLNHLGYMLLKFKRNYIPDTVDYMKKKIKTVIPISYHAMTVTLCKLLHHMIRKDMKYIQTVDEKERSIDEMKLESMFCLCAVWAFGGALAVKDNRNYRKIFSDHWKSKFKRVKFPSTGLVFDYYIKLDGIKAEFEEWRSLLTDYHYDGKVPMNNVTIPIPETLSIKNLTKSLIVMGHPVMYIGNSGAGKTQLIKGLLKEMRIEHPNDYYYSSVNFNYYTDADYLRTMLEQDLVKQGNRYGPKKGGKFKLIYFVDDLNMPTTDKYDTQSAIALLRQHVDYSHWYDISKAVPIMKEIINTQIITAMNPTSGSFFVNPRYQRHFWISAIPFPENNSLNIIYEAFLKGHFAKFKPEILILSAPLIKAAIGLHEKVVTSFRKTAANFHYEFNIRHLSNIFSGVLQSKPEFFNDGEKIIKLWIHESERIYSDRLVSRSHIEKYNKLSIEVLKSSFGKYTSIQKFYAPDKTESLIFNDFPEGYQGQRFYGQVPFDTTVKWIEEALNDYNSQNAEMALVLFEDAIKHVCRITRIVSESGGHALLVGVGGSGRQSLTKLAAFIKNLSLFSITVSNTYGTEQLKGDLIELYKKCGEKDNSILFLITDSHITDEKFLVYINDLLASGEIADLFTEDDKLTIYNNIRTRVKGDGVEPTPDNMWTWYINKIRENLHVSLCFSPVGDLFASRARKFPGLITATVIDWFHSWPEIALKRVAKMKLEETLLEIEVEKDSEMMDKIISFMPYSFEVVNEEAKKIYKSDRRHIHNTPKTFLELVALFKQMLVDKRETLIHDKTNYEIGLAKLNSTEEIVKVLEADLEIKNVEVNKKKAEASVVAEAVGKEKAIVEEENKKATAKEKECSIISIEVQKQKDDCESDVKKLEPMVKEALSKVENLDPKSIGEIRTFKKAPPGVDKVFFCIMFMFAGVPGGYDANITLKKNKTPKDLTWKGCLTLLKDAGKILKDLMKFPKEIERDNVPKQNFKLMEPYFKDPNMQDPKKMKVKSTAAAAVLEFLTSMRGYYTAMKQMIPKREKLKEATFKLEQAESELSEVRELVAKLNEELSEKITELNRVEKIRDDAQAEADKCNNQLSLAKRLVGALSSEKVRWADSIDSLDIQIKVIIGDVILASSFISYAGPFTKKYREHMIEEKFKGYLRNNNILMSENLEVVNFLVDEATKAEWNNEGLPSDKVSIENGTILMNSERFPLMIDPQLQGITWIKKKLKEDGLVSMRIGAKNYLNVIQRSIVDGVPVLLENLDDNIEAIIFPVIARKIIKKNNKTFLDFLGKQELHPDFRLYMQTKMSNPHYPPEIQAEAALINFTVTEVGLSDQLLSLVVSRERPDLERTKIKLIKDQNKFKITLKDLEKDLLSRLTSANDDNLLENIELIENLEKSKALSEEIKEKVEVAKVTEVEIIRSSEIYRPTAVRGALIFFLMNELYKMSSFYMYSLESFVNIINLAIDYVTEDLPEPEHKEHKEGEEGHKEEKKPDEQPEKEEIEENKEEGEEKKEEVKEKEKEKEGEEKEGEENDDEEGEGEDEGEEEEGEDDAEDKEVEEPNTEELDLEDLNVKVLTPRSLDKRVKTLTESITYTAYENVRRGLFENHKLIFATLMTLRILMKSGKLKAAEVDHLIVGKQIGKVNYPDSESLKSYINEQMYTECKALESIPAFDGLSDSLVKDHLQWKKWFQAEKAEEADLPKEYKEISFFHKLMLIRALRPDRVTYTLRLFVIQEMGRNYIEQPPFNMEKVFLETSSSTPIFFVLFPGVNPTPEVERMGLKKGITADKLMDISMGQGQEERAIEELEKACKQGTWIFLQNVHLMETWIKLFERKLEEYSADAHENFRCFISSEQPPKNNPTQVIVPEAILQRCIKISNEAPSDLVSNMKRAYSKFSEDRIKNAPQTNVFKSILFGLCYFHAVVLGRKKFGSAGWSKVYNFNDGDLTICADVLENYLSKYDKVPYDDLRYIYGEIMYGGHITDDWDRRTNNTYLEVLITPELLNKANIIPSAKKIVRVPDPAKSSYQDYWDLIDQFQDERPYMFGMHSNAEINFLTNQCDYVFSTIVDIRGDVGAGGVGEGGDSGPAELVERYLKLPETFNMLELRSKVIDLNRTAAGIKTASPDDAVKFPPEPFQNVALQECETMAKLLHEMKTSLEDLKLGLQGDLNMTEAMDELAKSLILKRVPDNWAQFYQSKKPLPSWFEDMKERKKQLDHWVEEFERPLSLCISYLFNPMSFLTAIMQVKAKEHSVALDSVCLNTVVTKFMEPKDIKIKSESEEERSQDSEDEGEDDEHKDSVFIHGLFLEGASWENNTRVGYLTEMKANELHPPLPVIGVQAVKTAEKSMKAQYVCPVYYTTFRGPTYVFTANLNMESDDHKESQKWILAGVALIMNEDF